mmetsp:Transcript_6960/g.16114  ORF Transcript_6960/g.16114 Transcript_6960/m.16114 type:complete len:249 (-) Transcript_6960:154-900(-)
MLVVLLALTHDDELGPPREALRPGSQEPGHNACEHVHAFLPGQAAHEPEQHCLRGHEEACLPLQRRLAVSPASGKAAVSLVAAGNVWICAWVPLVIQSIPDANQTQHLALLAKESVQPETALRRLYLEGVVAGHSDHTVAAEDGPLAEVEVRVLHQVQSRRFAKAKQGADVGATAGEAPLETKVVDDVDAPGMLIYTTAAVAMSQVNRHQRCLPIIRDEGHAITICHAIELEPQRDLECSQGQHCKTI